MLLFKNVKVMESGDIEKLENRVRVLAEFTAFTYELIPTGNVGI